MFFFLEHACRRRDVLFFIYIRVIKQIGTNFGSGTNLAPLKFVPVQTGTNFWDKFSMDFLFETDLKKNWDKFEWICPPRLDTKEWDNT